MTNLPTSDQPNLFSFATSELSQDAFICWLAAWADPQYEQIDVKLHEVALIFISSIIRKIKSAFDPSVIRTVDIGRQVGKLDILIEVNKGLSDRLAILIEDKTHTSNHSDQLNRYYDQVGKNYGGEEMIPVYFKTGYQSRFDTLGAFKPYLRSDFLEVLRQGKRSGIENAIFSDFLAHLEQMEWAISQFSVKPLNDWKENDWKGFYMVLYDNRYKINNSTYDDGANWNYVANPSGGFWGYWWYFTELPGKSYMPYLQLEQGCLAFKIEVKTEADRRQARDEAYQCIMKVFPQTGLEISRPVRMGNGRFMTIAHLKNEYRVVNEGSLDIEATLTNMKKAQDLLDAAFRL